MTSSNRCKHCNQEFLDIDSKIFANHVRWCSKNITNGDKGRSNLSQRNIENFLARVGSLRDYSVTCEKCQKVFTVSEREKRHPERSSYYCSRSCANTRGPRTDTFKEKVSVKLKGRIRSQRIDKKCEWCTKTFQVTVARASAKCCSSACSKRNRYKNVDTESLEHYRSLCSFNFNLSDFPNEFDFTLIEKYGWYKAKNRGDNLEGVSRDHIVSVKFGYENGIDPKILSHPANCQLLRHGNNVSKGKRSLISYEQLLQKIIEWNTRYGERT